ncbi:cold shock domain-containing protein [Pontibacter sp. Tf4]|uniref:cold-shock protein n=1 Tax=Pontibacter sp. Tf4 TaxID=2761620 RepID=UPI0016245E7B|nr:cold shock domain-containing protein [Pontibacter sp. Tf4]MBB6610612.1 cold shock domain-containing protein [Pontibacter sp. Tf4]
MGRSQETFSKKEKEKKKLRKRQDKEQKREDRKTHSSKGKGIDEMMAYVDEFGNISDTPPDPTKKKKDVKAEDIQINISRQAPPDPEDLIRKGTVTMFNASKGYGFIRDHDTQESIFVHQNGLAGTIAEGNKVTFEVEKGQKGLVAVKVKLVS